jgi:hypothetical protein
MSGRRRLDPSGLRQYGHDLRLWAQMLGDFRLTVPAAAFAKYLAPQWKAAFTAG